TWLDYSTMWCLSRTAIDPASATGGIFQTYSPGPRCRPRCVLFVPWKPIGYAGNSTSRTIHKRVTGSGRPRYRLIAFPSIASSIWAPTMGYRELWVNELANEWHSDHVFKHDSGAIECFLLVAFLPYNIFHVFLARNVKPS